MKKLAILLTLALLLGSFSFPAFAWEPVLTEDPMYDASAGDTLFEEETITFDYFRTRPLKEGETLRRGVDVSFYQNENSSDNQIDWKALKADGVDFVFIRVGYRGYSSGLLSEDPYYKDNIEGALSAGLIVGVYVYSQAITVEEGKEEAQFLLDRIGNYDVQLPLIMDYEYASSNRGRLYNAKLSKADATAICNAFCEVAGNAGYQAAVYANPSFLNNQLYADQLSCVWLAHYIKETNYSGDYSFWQCTSSGSVDGIVGLTDLNFWYDDGSFLTFLPFRDVKTTDWFYDEVSYAYHHNLTYGTSYCTFAPTEITTRSQIVSILYRIAGSPAVTKKPTFWDVGDDYYTDAVAWGQSEGIVSGVPGNLFLPLDAITRQDMICLIYRMEGSPKVTGSLSKYSDAAEVSDYAVDAMTWAVKEGILYGVSETTPTLNPMAQLTRSEAVAFLARYVQMK